jgi:hypothetical protein
LIFDRRQGVEMFPKRPDHQRFDFRCRHAAHGSGLINCTMSKADDR